MRIFWDSAGFLTLFSGFLKDSAGFFLTLFRDCLKDTEVFLFTFEGIAAGVDAEGDRDEEGENLFGGARGPLHQTRHVKQRVEDEEERRPQPHSRIKGEKVQFKVLADAVNHCNDIHHLSYHHQTCFNRQFQIIIILQIIIQIFITRYRIASVQLRPMASMLSWRMYL